MKKRICQSVYVIFFLTVLLISGRTDLPRGETLRENRLVTGMMIENDKTGSQKKLTAERDMDTIRDCWELLDGLEGKRMPDTDGFTVAVFFSDKTIDTYLVGKEEEAAYGYLSVLFENMEKYLSYREKNRYGH